MATLLYGNISTKTASFAIEPGTIDLPRVVQGDTFTLAVRLTETADNTTTVTRPTISSARLSYGPVDVAPTAGTFKMVVGGVTSGVVTIGASAASVAAVLNNLSATTGWTVALDRDSYIVSRNAAWTATSGITITDNRLEPESFVRVTSWSANNLFYQELRPMQSPLAYTSAFALIVPPAPTITRVVTGFSDPATGVEVNEVQRLYVHPQFDGVFQIYKGTARTQLLDKEDGAPEIQAALIAGCTTKGTDETFLVTNPRNNTADIEFAGGLGGAAQNLLTVVVPESLQGDVTFDLDLNTQGMLAALRDSFEVTHPLTCEVGINYGTIVTPNVKYVTVFQQNMTVQADGAWTGLAAAQRINWLNPPQPVNYIPFTTDQVITGIQSYTVLVSGYGPWTIAHNLATEAIHVTIRQTTANRSILTNGSDYSVTITNANSIVITAGGSNPEDEQTDWAVMISSAGPTSAFLAHTHTIDQIETLRDTLSSLGQRVGDLENVLPNNAGVINQAGVDTTPLTITVPERAAVLFADVEGAWGGKGIERGKLPRRGPSLLRAISTATPVNSPVATVPTSSGVYLYSGGIELPPMGYIPGQIVPPGGAVAYEGDGRIYRVRQELGKNTWFPVPYEVELFRIPVNSSQLRVGRTLTCNFGLTLQMLAETDAQWRVVIDAANLSGASSPADQGLNLTAADFNQIAMLDHRVLLTEALTPHIFGVQILRRLVDGNVQMSANRNLYGTYESAGGPPATGDFILRARLINFDIAENGGDVRGWVGYHLAGVQDNGIGGDIKVTIK